MRLRCRLAIHEWGKLYFINEAAGYCHFLQKCKFCEKIKRQRKFTNLLFKDEEYNRIIEFSKSLEQPAQE